MRRVYLAKQRCVPGLVRLTRAGSLDPGRIHFDQPVFLQVLPHDPTDVGVIAGEPLLHERLADVGPRDDRDAPAIGQALAQGFECV